MSICGTLSQGYEVVFDHGIDAVFSIASGPCYVEEAIQNGSEYLEATARNIARVIELKSNRQVV